MTIGGGAQPVVVSTEAPDGGPARPVAVVSAPFYVIGGPPLKVVEVADNRARIGGPAMPIVAVSGQAAASPAAGAPIPVYVVSGSLYLQKVQALNPIAYWTLSDASGPTITDASGNGRTGTYVNVTLGAIGIGDGRTAATFNGTTSVGNVFSAGLAAAFSGLEGTLAAWVQVSAAGVWTDAAVRQVAEFRADTNNFVDIIKNSTNNQMMLRFRAAGATIKSVDLNGLTSTGWLHVALSWSKSADAFKGYLNGAQVGATQSTLATFAGSIASTTTTIGALNTTPTQVWSGNLAHIALWSIALNAAQVATLARI